MTILAITFVLVTAGIHVIKKKQQPDPHIEHRRTKLLIKEGTRR